MSKPSSLSIVVIIHILCFICSYYVWNIYVSYFDFLRYELNYTSFTDDRAAILPVLMFIILVVLVLFKRVFLVWKIGLLLS